MVRLSRYPLSDNKLEKLFDLSFTVIGKRSTKNEFVSVLNEVLSTSEKIMIAKRIALLYLLEKDIRHDVICHVLKLSSATVAKFAFAMQSKQDSTLKRLFKHMMQNEAIKNVAIDIFNTIFAPGVPGVNWSAAWQRVVEQERRKIEGL